MNDIVVDSSVVAKWFLPEADSVKAQEVITRTVASGGELIVLDLVFPEVANAIWKRLRQKLITAVEAADFLRCLQQMPVRMEPAAAVLGAGFDIATKYDRSVYDALFVALAKQRGVTGITADEPLYNSTHLDFPQIVLLRNW